MKQIIAAILALVLMGCSAGTAEAATTYVEKNGAIEIQKTKTISREVILRKIMILNEDIAGAQATLAEYQEMLDTLDEQEG